MAERKYKHPQVNLRLPEELKEKVSELAAKNGRSSNAEMVAAIEHWVAKKSQIKSAIYQNSHDEESTERFMKSPKVSEIRKKLMRDFIIEIKNNRHEIASQIDPTDAEELGLTDIDFEIDLDDDIEEIQ